MNNVQGISKERQKNNRQGKVKVFETTGTSQVKTESDVQDCFFPRHKKEKCGVFCFNRAFGLLSKGNRVFSF